MWLNIMLCFPFLVDFSKCIGTFNGYLRDHAWDLCKLSFSLFIVTIVKNLHLRQQWIVRNSARLVYHYALPDTGQYYIKYNITIKLRVIFFFFPTGILLSIYLIIIRTRLQIRLPTKTDSLNDIYESKL